MKQKQYRDSSPSREIEEDEEDWEASGTSEVNRIYAECTYDGSRKQADYNDKKSILDVRDRLNNLISLVTVCREALCESKLIDIKEIVSDVLYFQIEEQIKTAEQELANL